MKRRFFRRPEEAFSEAVEFLRTGGSIDAFLKEHPEPASELAPLLDTVTSVRARRAVPARPAEIALASRERFMAAAQRTVVAPSPKPLGVLAGWAALFGNSAGSRRLSYAMAALLAVVLLLGLSTTGVVTAAASALPGEPLYQVKLASEQVQLLLARDDSARQAIERAIADRRILEAQTITQLRRPVMSMAVGGQLEALSDTEWQVAGLKIGITPQTRINGAPELGAQVSGTVQAPGDGRLIALELNVQSTRRQSVAPTATDTLTPTATSQPPTLTPTATQVPATPTNERPALILPTQSSAPTSTSLPTSTPTSAPTATRTRTPSPTAGPSPTPLRSTPQLNRKIGTVTYIEGRRWTIKEVETILQVLADDKTEWVKSPQLGDRVEVAFIILDGVHVATRIEKVGGSDATPEPFDFSGLIQKIDGEWWTVRGITFRVTTETEIEGDPGIDRHAEVHAERRAGEDLWAKRIRVRSLPEYEFTGAIETVGRDSIIVRGVSVFVDSLTKYLGDPPMVGRLADVQAIQFADGRLMARIIYTWPPTPTPTRAITPTPRPTRTPSPSPNPTATFTWTPSPQPQASATPTATPQPSFTPPPTATFTPIVASTSTVQAAAVPTRKQ
jgi:hypothetical protein